MNLVEGIWMVFVLLYFSNSSENLKLLPNKKLKQKTSGEDNAPLGGYIPHPSICDPTPDPLAHAIAPPMSPQSTPPPSPA